MQLFTSEYFRVAYSRLDLIEDGYVYIDKWIEIITEQQSNIDKLEKGLDEMLRDIQALKNNIDEQDIDEKFTGDHSGKQANQTMRLISFEMQHMKMMLQNMKHKQVVINSAWIKN